MHVSQLKTRAIAVVGKLNKKTDKPVAVVLNTGDANSYGIVINLGREGVPIISVSSKLNNITFVSRYSKGVICPDHQDSEEALIDFLEFIGRSLLNKPVLFVNGDEQLMVLLKYQDRIGAVYYFPYAPYDIAEKLVNKVSFYRLLDEIGAPHALTYLPRDIDEMATIAPTLEYPYIIKPAQSMTFYERFGNKCLCAHSASEAADLFSQVAREDDKIIVQKQIIGDERYLVYTYFSSNSKPVGVCCYRKVRIYPTDFGNACVCETVSDKEVIELFLNVLERIGYCGLAEAEIQRDACDGKLKLVEINARSTTQDRLSAYCGINMEFLAYRDVLGLVQDSDCIVNQEMGVLWIDLFRDILAVFASNGYRYQKKITTAEWWRSLRGRRVFAYCALEDPLPALKIWFQLIRIYGFSKNRISGLLSMLKSRAGQKVVTK